MEVTGERYHPTLTRHMASSRDYVLNSYEHWHRYLFAAGFVAGKAVLDVACGEGYGSDLLARTAARVVGVDVAADAVDHAARLYRRDNLSFRRGPASRIPVDED